MSAQVLAPDELTALENTIDQAVQDQRPLSRHRHQRPLLPPVALELHPPRLQRAPAAAG
jgi:hypothetical protein